MIRKLFLTILVTTGLLFGQGKTTDGRFNGRMWESMSDLRRAIFVSGIFEGIEVVRLKQTTAEEAVAKGFTSGDYTKELDKFYSATENTNIPIAYAFDYCTLRLADQASPDFLHDRLKALRIVFNKASHESPPPK